jgi:hypothetical protein
MGLRGFEVSWIALQEGAASLKWRDAVDRDEAGDLEEASLGDQPHLPRTAADPTAMSVSEAGWAG